MPARCSGRGGPQAGRGPARRTNRWGAAAARPARARRVAQVKAADRGRARRGDAINAAVASIPFGLGVRVSGALVVEVADHDGAVGPLAQVGSTKPSVPAVKQLTAVLRPKRRTRSLQSPRRCGVLQEVAADERALEAVGQGIAEIHRPARPRAGNRVVIRQVLEEAVGVRVVEWSVLAEVLAVVRTLHSVVSQIIPVGREEQVAVGVERESEQVAAPLAKQLEPFRQRMKSPDGLLELDPGTWLPDVLPVTP